MITAIVYYSLASRCIRRWTRPSFKDEVLVVQVGQGEGMIELNEDEYQAIVAQARKMEQPLQYAIQDFIVAWTGQSLGSDRCVIVDRSIVDPVILSKDGNVKGVIHADPTCDSMDGCDLVIDQVADVGWKYTAQDGFVKVAEAIVDGI